MTEEFKIMISLRVDWSDLDLFGHVNNVAFFRYVQAGRLNYCETMGLTALNDPDKYSFMVASSLCRFKKPLLYPGDIKVFTKADWIKNSSFQLAYKIMNHGNELVAEAEDILVLFDHYQKKKVSFSDTLIGTMEQMEGRAIHREQ